MDHSRRAFVLAMSGLAAQAAAQETGSDSTRTLLSKTYSYAGLPVRVNGPNSSRRVFNGELHSGFAVEMHETELDAGLAPHPPHRHEHEEIVIVNQGTLDVMIAGKSTKLGPGSVAFIGSNDEHGWRNVGATKARYFLIAVGPDRGYRDRVGR